MGGGGGWNCEWMTGSSFTLEWDGHFGPRCHHPLGGRKQRNKALLNCALLKCPDHFTDFSKPVTAISEKYQKVREGKGKKLGRKGERGKDKRYK